MRLLLKHPLRRFIHRPLSSIMFILAILIISTSFLVIFSSESMIESSFSYNLHKKYGESDIAIDLGNNYEERFFSTRVLEEHQEQFDFSVSFLVLPFQIQNQTFLLYFVDYASFLKIFPDQNRGEDFKLNGFQVLVSDDQLDHQIAIEINNKIMELKVVGRIEKKGILKDVDLPVIIIDHQVLNQIYLPIFDHIQNQVYLKIKDGKNKADIYNELAALFPNQVVRFIHSKDVDRSINVYVNSIRVISLVTFIPLCIMLFLLARFNFKKNEKEMLTLKSLGITRSKAFIFFWMEYILFTIIGFGLSLFLWYFLSLQMIKYLTKESIFLIANSIVLAFTTFFAIQFFILVFYAFNFHKLYKVSYQEARSTLQLKYQNVTNLSMKQRGIIFLCIFIIYIATFLLLRNLFPRPANHFFKGISLGILTLLLIGSFLFFLLGLIHQFFHSDKRFHKVELKLFTSNRLQYWFLLATVLVGSAVVISIHSLTTLLPNIYESKDDLNFNLVITNITLRHDQYDSYLNNDSELVFYEKGFCYTKVRIEDYNYSIPLVISIDGSKLSSFTNFHFEDETIELMKDKSQLAIILSKRYQEVYGLKVGDSIQLNINNDQNVVTYKVAGFIEQKQEIFAFINTYQNQNAGATHPFNAIFIKSNDPLNTKQNLEKNFISDSVTLFQLEEYYHTLVYNNYNRYEFVRLLVILIVFCITLTLALLFTYIYIDNLRVYDILAMLGDYPGIFISLKKSLVISSIVGPLMVVATLLLAYSIQSLLASLETLYYLDNLVTITLMVTIGFIVLQFIFGITEWIANQKRELFQFNRLDN